MHVYSLHAEDTWLNYSHIADRFLFQCFNTNYVGMNGAEINSESSDDDNSVLGENENPEEVLYL